MCNFEIIGDKMEEINEVLYEEFIEEVNWAFVEAFELPL